MIVFLLKLIKYSPYYRIGYILSTYFYFIKTIIRISVLKLRMKVYEIYLFGVVHDLRRWYYFHQINCFIHVINVINWIIADDKATTISRYKKISIDIFSFPCVLTKDAKGLMYLALTVTNHAHPTVKTTCAT